MDSEDLRLLVYREFAETGRAPDNSDLAETLGSSEEQVRTAIVIGGNGFRAVGAIAALEERLELPVVTANQALLWAALRAASADTHLVTSYGQLFTRSAQHDQGEAA